MTTVFHLARLLAELAETAPLAYALISSILATLAGLAAQVAFGDYR
jgi:hypothetical protein